MGKKVCLASVTQKNFTKPNTVKYEEFWTWSGIPISYIIQKKTKLSDKNASNGMQLKEDDIY